MIISVRLQAPWDVDLISLAANNEFDIKKWFKKALIAWATEDTSFVIPCPKSLPFYEKPERQLYHLYFGNNGADPQVVAKLDQLQSGWRNAFVKILFRHYMEMPYLTAFGPEDLFAKLSWLNGEKALHKEEAYTVPVQENKTEKKNRDNPKDLILAKGATDAATLIRLAEHSDPRVRLAVADNPSAPAEALYAVYDIGDEDGGVDYLYSLASNVATPSPLLDKLISDWSIVGVKKLVALHPNLSMKQAIKLCRDPDGPVREAMASNPELPSACYGILVTDEEPDVRKELLKNPNFPISLIEILLQDEDESVRALAGNRHLNMEKEEENKEEEQSVKNQKKPFKDKPEEPEEVEEPETPVKEKQKKKPAKKKTTKKEPIKEESAKEEPAKEETNQVEQQGEPVETKPNDTDPFAADGTETITEEETEEGAGFDLFGAIHKMADE